ncbi:hypothetical protein GQ53DRAFT_547450 [Thozetella sp. PMI_491]|nr:hypothetical protein GQ53DRAFT_547450 [Thozetella sp. PMI_491]
MNTKRILPNPVVVTVMVATRDIERVVSRYPSVWYFGVLLRGIVATMLVVVGHDEGRPAVLAQSWRSLVSRSRIRSGLDVNLSREGLRTRKHRTSTDKGTGNRQLLKRGDMSTQHTDRAKVSDT